MTTPYDKALEPCPFCGNSDIRFDRHRGAGRGFHSGEDVWSMCCYKCGASVPNMFEDYGRQKMVEAWNRRAPLPIAGKGDEGWRPIETAPKDGTPILAIYPWRGSPRFMVIRRHKEHLGGWPTTIVTSSMMIVRILTGTLVSPIGVLSQLLPPYCLKIRRVGYERFHDEARQF
ncbi:Lar family restriction alleviation protein [Rhizobium rhizogenes]|nr:restriction alleviation protein, Lar family [Rhizobium rhizogenes]NTJ22560.1 restriction alleviation protein, Lar family [Rhizobium rhizogenes]QUE81266.1 Lar family restriction alleviation protein [Rhizobium rhizogenes]